MPKFYDQIEALKNVEGDYPGNFIDDLVGAYDADVDEINGINTEASELSAAKILELEAANAALQAEIVTIKAARFDEIMSTPVDGGDDSDEEEDNSDDSDDDMYDDDTDPFENLFK